VRYSPPVLGGVPVRGGGTKTSKKSKKP
jgi:hypothetical protein